MKFIKKIIIDNFQSHEHSELEFDSSLNIIVGQSDKGKSAVIRALKWVLYNEPRGTDFMRYGTNECTVTILTGDGYTVTRKRKTNKNIYVVIRPDGEKFEFENFGNDVPVEVLEATGMKKIKLDTDTEAKLNLNEQLDPPFLLSETGTMRAKAIGRIVNTNIIDAAERDILKDISNNNLVIKGFERQLVDIEEELKNYSDIEAEEKNIQRLDSLLEKVSSIDSKIQKLREYKNKVELINESIKQNSELLNRLKPLPTVSDLFNDVKDKYMYCQRLCSFRDKIKKLESDIAKDKDILEKVRPLETIENSIKAVDSKIDICNKITDLNEKLTEVQSKITKGKEYMNELTRNLKQCVSQYSLKLKHLGKCPTCYSLISDNTLNQIINELEGEMNVRN